MCPYFLSSLRLIYWPIISPSIPSKLSGTFIHTGCPKKKWDLCLNAHNTPCKWTTDKSRVSFGKFRKFPFHWAQEHLFFGKKWIRKLWSKLPTPPLKTYISEWHTIDFALVSVVCIIYAYFWLQLTHRISINLFMPHYTKILELPSLPS